MTGEVSIHLYDAERGVAAEELVQFYADFVPDFVPRVGDHITYEVPRAEQEDKKYEIVEGDVDEVRVTYRGKSVLVEVFLVEMEVITASS